MIKVQSSLQFQQAMAKSLLKQDSPLSTAAGNETRPRAVNTQSPAGIPLDSLEELGSLFSEKMEKKTKGLNRRQINTAHLRSNRKSVERIESLIELYQMLDDQQQDRLETRLGEMRSALGKPGEQSADSLVEAAEGDPARCDLMLRMALREADRTGDHQLAAAASSGLDKLHEAFGGEVKAGLNTAKAIASFTTDPDEKQSIRNLYYKGIVRQQSAAAIFDSLLERFGHEQMVPGLRTLQRALSEDIAAFTPSLKSSSLRRIHLGLAESRHVGQLITQSTELLDRLRSRGKIPVVAAGGIDMARRVLSFAANGMEVNDLKNIGNDYAGQHPAAQMIFFNGLLPLVNKLPLPLWKDIKWRGSALQKLSVAIDVLVKKENNAAAKS
ncbi:type III secretion system gatekeeper subunit SctW [Erwinia sp. 9145]|uniref:type III secretion system gatekeeper subunit SctW n=1 Tax=Erwinia sp. 9145 TaxID=1500895 RepID=UPI00068C4B5F|nr:type III secretion system gatekeeper subunit SctW [Erwinia sp. 9145]